MAGKHNTKQTKRKRKELVLATDGCVRFYKCSCLPASVSPDHNPQKDISLQEIHLRWPHVMVATMFRWPELLDKWKLEQHSDKHSYSTQPADNPNSLLLRKLPGTPCSNTSLFKMERHPEDYWICCNPFHWSCVIPNPYPIKPHILEGNTKTFYGH